MLSTNSGTDCVAYSSSSATTKHTTETSLHPKNKHMRTKNTTKHTPPGPLYSLLHTSQCTISLMAPISSRIGMECVT